MKKPISWELNKDPYYRTSLELAEADVSYSENTRASGSTEKLARTILKAVQDTFYVYISEDSVQIKKVETQTEALFQKYKKRSLKNRIEKANRSNELFNDEKFSKIDELKKQAFLMEGELKRLAKKEAWRNVLVDSISEEALTIRFYSKDITQVADLKNYSSTLLFKEVQKIQNKFHMWSEKVFDELTGEVVVHEHNSTLIPSATLIRRGKGNPNEIEISLNRKMLHLILFLQQNFLKYHLELAVKLKDPGTTILYELIVKMLSPKYKKRNISVEDIKKTFHSSTKNLPQFKRMFLNKNLNKLNKILHTDIELIDIKEGRKIVAFNFKISKLDEDLLMGKRETADFYMNDIRQSFGYYRALLLYHQGKLKKEYISVRAIELNDDKSFSEELGKLYRDYTENIEAFEMLESMSRSEFPTSYELDIELMTLVNRRTNEFFAKTSFSCLEKLKAQKNIKEQKTLFDDENKKDEWELTIEDFFPFEFKITSLRVVLIDAKSFNEYKIRIEVAVRFKDIKAFVFDSDEKRLYFMKKVMKEEITVEEPAEKTIHAEIIDNSFEFADIFLSKIREGNQIFQVGSEYEWEQMFTRLFNSYSLEENEFKSNIEFVVLFITSSKAGRKYYLPNLKNAQWVESKWGDLTQKANVWARSSEYNSSIAESHNISVFDLYMDDDAENERKAYDRKLKNEEPF